MASRGRRRPAQRFRHAYTGRVARARKRRLTGYGERRSASCHLTSVGNFGTRYRSNLRGLNRRDGRCVAVQSRELNLERLAVRIDVNHGPDVANLQTLLWKRRRQNDSVMFLITLTSNSLPG